MSSGIAVAAPILPPQGPATEPVAIYIHWPWCKAKCPYCDFNSHTGTVHEQSYIDGVLNELRGWGAGRVIGAYKINPFNPLNRRVGSVFFGGGTPSLISAANLRQVIDSCRELGTFTDDTEITVECNPTSFDEERPAGAFFSDLKAAGVTRVSIGIQGLKPEWLAFLGRTHRVEEALATLDAAQSVFDNVNADVIYGLPEQALGEWTKQLESLSERGLAHISAYQLTIEQNTRFFKDVKNGLWEPISGDIEADFFEATRETLIATGYENYEISNFAKSGKACRHNLQVWRYGEYLGIGAGAHGRVRTSDGLTMATQIVRQPEGYLRRVKSGEDCVSQAVVLNSAETAQEAVFSGLRLAEGCDMEWVRKHVEIPAYQEGISTPEVAFLVESGFLEWHGNHLRLTSMGWPRLNSVLQRVLRPLTPPTPPSNRESGDTPNAYTSGISVSIV